uniref:Uncharacterized protein n=1 Tax=Anopheles farauti TaxID=69004 RepID=A0A182PZU6_9DIPT
MLKQSSLVYKEMMCFFMSWRLLMLKHERSWILRLAPVPSHPLPFFVNDCLNFFSLSKYSSRANFSGKSPYTTKYFFLFVFNLRWYPCRTTFSDSGMTSDDPRPVPDDPPILLAEATVEPVELEEVFTPPDATVLAIVAESSVPAAAGSVECAAAEAAVAEDADDCIIFERENGFVQSHLQF